MVENNIKAYSEIYSIINLLEDEYLEKIPKKVIDFFDEERDKEYNPIIDVDVSLFEQNLQRKTVVLLIILKLNYWCSSEEEKQEIIDNLYKNKQIKMQNEKEIEEQYNIDNIFNKKNEVREKITESSENMQLVEYKEQGFIKRLLNILMVNMILTEQLNWLSRIQDITLRDRLLSLNEKKMLYGLIEIHLARKNY